MPEFVIEGWELRPLVGTVEAGILKRIDVPPTKILAEQWDAFKAGGDLVALEGLRSQVEGADPPKAEVDHQASTVVPDVAEGVDPDGV